MTTDEIYMHRCLQLAKLASGQVAPNPMVGAILVCSDVIIGEGYHQLYGQAHAEVNCLAAVKAEHRHLIQQSTLYVSLEPCAHFGKTPPCADLIIQHQIPKIIVGCRDPFEQVNGKGIEKLEAAGVEVITGILEKECIELNKAFFAFHQLKRPYIILKWAQSANRKIAGAGNKTVAISNPFSNRLVHSWRSNTAAIMVGTNTAAADDPQLNTRLWPGKNPVRLVLDMHLRLSPALRLFDGSITTILFNYTKHQMPRNGSWLNIPNGLYYYKLEINENVPAQVLAALYSINLSSVLIEGGAYFLQSFINAGLWDEARLITNEGMNIYDGLDAPVLQHHQLIKTEQVFTDTLQYFIKAENDSYAAAPPAGMNV